MKYRFLFILSLVFLNSIQAKEKPFEIPRMPEPAARRASMEKEWEALQKTPPGIGVRDCFMFLLDALDTRFLTNTQTEWLLQLIRSRVITDTSSVNFGNIYWGWEETNNDAGDGNNVEFCVQYGILIKILFNDRLSAESGKMLDEIFEYAIQGVRNHKVRLSYTNILLMKIWNLTALGQVYHQPAAVEEGRKLFVIWLNHISKYGNREYDSPTYCGVDLESLLLIWRFSNDKDIRTGASDALDFFLTELFAHYNPGGGFLGGAHSRDYNRVFGLDLLEEKYMNPLLGFENKNDHLFHQICFSVLKEKGINPFQKSLMNRPGRYIVQRWDSIPNAFTCDYAGKKFSIASSNQSYSPDDKAFVIYLSSKKTPRMLNTAYTMEGRNDHYGTWAAEGKGEKLKHLMPAGYPPNGGWGKARHLMYFMQAAQNKNEFVMVAAGEKDHNCINNYLNSTIILPDAFDEIWIGPQKIKVPAIGEQFSLDQTNTFFGRFEDVGVAIRVLWDNGEEGTKMSLFNDGFVYKPSRESFKMDNNKGLRLTLQHPCNGKGAIAMWWKAEEGIRNGNDFAVFRHKVLDATIGADEKDGIADIFVLTPSGKLGVRADLNNKKRLGYYYPRPLPENFLFNVDGVEIGKPILEKYKLK